MEANLLAELQAFYEEAAVHTFAAPTDEIRRRHFIAPELHVRKGFTVHRYVKDVPRWFYERASRNSNAIGAGDEIIYLKKDGRSSQEEPVFVHRYEGELTPAGLEQKDAVQEFLMRALRTRNLVFQPHGPEKFLDGKWAYVCLTYGRGIAEFNGTELITLGGTAMYRHRFSGRTLE